MAKTPDIRILQRLSQGLGTMKGIRGSVREYGTDTVNRSQDGTDLGEFKSRSLHGSKHYLQLFWSDLDKAWYWGSTDQELQELVKKLKLRGGKGTPEEGEIITTADREDFDDSFFNHDFWYARKWMEGGKIIFDINKTEDRIFYFSYKANRDTIDRESPERNAAFAGSAKYELISPKIAAAKKSIEYKGQADATVAIANMTFEDRKMIAQIMGLTTVDWKNLDPDRLFVSMMDEIVNQGDSKVRRYGNKTSLEYFKELNGLERQQLFLRHKVMLAKKAGILRNKGTHWQFNTGTSSLPDKITVSSNDASIINFFEDDENSEYYVELVHQLEEREKAKK